MAEFTPREEFESLLALSDHHVERFRLRQTHEWKISFGFWALLVASLIYVRADIPTLLKVLLAVMAFIHIMWIFFMHVRHYHELRRAYFYRDLAESKVLGIESEASKRVPPWPEMTNEAKREIWREVLSAPFFWTQAIVSVVLTYLNISSADFITRIVSN